jgi:tetratricopeptide (TPR) repeat protein
MALEIDPQRANSWVLKEVVLDKLGRSKEAIQCCDKALAIDPQNAVAQQVKRMSSASK